MTDSEARRVVEAVWRIEGARLTASLARVVGDVSLADDLAQDALVAALEQWPADGIPDRPGAWLMGTAKHGAIDLLRRRQRLERKQEQLARELEIEQEATTPDFEETIDDRVGDGLLRLMFVACHPVLSREARVALTLRLLGGLTTLEIARGYLVAETTVAQRIVRAKRTLGEAHVPFEVPAGPELAARLSSVLEVISWSSADSRSSSEQSVSVSPSVRTRCRPPLPLATPGRIRRTRPTGGALPRCTTPWRRSRRLQSCS